MQTKLSSRIALLCFALLFVGCGPRGDGYRAKAKTYKVKGKFTFKGHALGGVLITFAPEGSQPAAIGKTNGEGEFKLMTYEPGDGAAAGDYKVTAMMLETDEPSASPDSAHAPNQEAYKPANSHAGKNASKSRSNMFPSLYANPKETTLKATVTAGGENNFTFEIK